jgi:uncharacterized protein YkwD
VRPRRRFVALLAAAALPTAPAVHAAPASAAACASAVPGATGAAMLRRAMTCVIAHERRRRGLPVFRTDRHLTRAAALHAAGMVRTSVFSHGDSMIGRVRAAGFAGPSAAEAIAWGCAAGAAPTAVLGSWLRSPAHRAVVLGRRWRLAGIGVAAGTPGGVCAGGTWVLDVGR